MDIRTSVIDKRLNNIKRTISVASGKGGVGKSLVASSLALNLSNKGYKVGLLDLDLYGPSSHVILGVDDFNFPEEKKGILPHKINDISFMSIVYFTQDKPAPLRGIDITNIIIELLAITQWGKLDYLIIDMPPGIGDATLDTIRLIPKLEFLVVTTPSLVAYQSVRRMLVLLKELGIPINGVIENMVMKPSDYVKSDIVELGLRYLGTVAYDETLEETIGDVQRLSETDFYIKIGALAPEFL